MLKIYAEGRNEDPRRVAARSSPSALLPHEVHIINNIERDISDIRRRNLEEQICVDEYESSDDAAVVEECMGPVSVRRNNIDNSEDEFDMSEDSGSE